LVLGNEAIESGR